jgi:o-succinylbenzoate synthase
MGPTPDAIELAKIEIRQVRLTLQYPFKTSFGTQRTRDTILIFLHSQDGTVGVGECPSLLAPIYDAQYVWADYDVLRRFLVPALLEGMSGQIQGLSTLMEVFAGIKGHRFAKCGLEAAFWHLHSQLSHVSLQDLWGGTASQVAAGFSIGGESIADVLARAEKAAALGIPRLKIKIWPGFDYDVVAAVREAYPDMMLQVDGNAAYEPDNERHRSALKSLDAFDLLMIEQPFADNRVFDHARFQKETDLKTPLCLDESLLDIHDAQQAVALWDMFGMKDRLVFNIKPPRVGGFAEARRIAEFCEREGIVCWVGGMLETVVGKWMNVIFASHPACTLPGDHLQPQPYYEQDIATPLLQADTTGMLAVPGDATPFVVDEDALESLTVEKWHATVH